MCVEAALADYAKAAQSLLGYAKWPENFCTTSTPFLLTKDSFADLHLVPPDDVKPLLLTRHAPHARPWWGTARTTSKLSAADLLTRAQNAVVAAPSGYGKTTMFRFLSCQQTTKCVEDEKAKAYKNATDPTTPIAVFVEAKHLVSELKKKDRLFGRGSITAEDVINAAYISARAQKQVVAAETLRKTLTFLLSHHQSVLLFVDSLDEVAVEADRREVITLLLSACSQVLCRYCGSCT